TANSPRVWSVTVAERCSGRSAVQASGPARVGAVGLSLRIAASSPEERTSMSSQAALGGRPPLPLALRTYRAVMSLARPAMWLLLRRRAERGKEDRTRRSERYGIAGIPRPAGDLLWLHAASVGETNAVLPLIERLLAA